MTCGIIRKTSIITQFGGSKAMLPKLALEIDFERCIAGLSAWNFNLPEIHQRSLLVTDSLKKVANLPLNPTMHRSKSIYNTLYGSNGKYCNFE